MIRLLPFICFMILSSTVSAQMTRHFDPIGATAATYERGISRPPFVSAPLADNVMFSYYNTELPTRAWPAPAEFSPYLVIMYGQRITLPNEYGFVDSVRIRLGQTQGDSIMVSLIHDTLFEVSSGQFAHIIDIFEPNTDYSRLAVPLSDTLPGGWLTVRFPKVLVRKDFFIVLEPYVNDAGQATSSFEWIGDDRQPEPRTLDNARSTFIAITPQNFYFSALLDSLFIFTGEDQPAFTDFYAEAYVDVTTQSVDRVDAANTKVYPNPVSEARTLFIEHTGTVRRVELYDLLGSTLEVRDGDTHRIELSTRSIPPGIYHLLITTDEGITSEKIVIH